MISLHVPVELPGIIRDLDVDRWQTIIVAPGVAASVHAHLSRMSGLVPFQYGSVAAATYTGNITTAAILSPVRPGRIPLCSARCPVACRLRSVCGGGAPRPAGDHFQIG